MRIRSLVLMALLALLSPFAILVAKGSPQHRMQYADTGSFSDDESADDEITDEPVPFAEYFETDPRFDPDTVVAGKPHDRLEWNSDAPAYPGDRPGSLTATYDANAEAGLFGLSLPQPYDHLATFTAAAVFVVHSEGFQADPNGFFQIS